MKKVAIVGVEGSGKTVMLAGLGDLYSHPDDRGYFLAPKDFRTAAYVTELMGRMRQGEWPAATAEDVFLGLDWTLRRKSDAGGRPTDVCELSCLDFAGEVYRKAFVDPEGQIPQELNKQVEALWDYIERADSLIVLINLGDVITHGLANRRVHESIWVTSAILEMALKERPGRITPKTAIVLSQADNYEAIIRECGGAKGALKKYLPHVDNSYGWLDVFPAYAVDKTVLDDSGTLVPAPGFTTEGLRPIMNWLLSKENFRFAPNVGNKRADGHALDKDRHAGKASKGSLWFRLSLGVLLMYGLMGWEILLCCGCPGAIIFMIFCALACLTIATKPRG